MGLLQRGYKGWLAMLEWMRLKVIWRRPTAMAHNSGKFHKFMIDSAASARLYKQKLVCGVALHQAEIKPYKTLTL